jgi:hypothetical protein
MSIMMLATETEEVAGADALDPDLRALLDHIAVELAAEYVRLMEATVTAEEVPGGSARDA